MVTYWPGSKSTQVIQAARSSKVFTSWVTSVMATTSTRPVSSSGSAGAAGAVGAAGAAAVGTADCAAGGVGTAAVGTPGRTAGAVGCATDLGGVPRPGARDGAFAAGGAPATDDASPDGRFE